MGLEAEAVFCPRCGEARPTQVSGETMVGRRLMGQYVIREHIGAGGMGVVYLADQPELGRQAVIKVLHPELCRDPQVRSRFDIEARAASQLNHPHIVTIYNYGAEKDGTLFIAMERCSGSSLAQALRAGPMEPDRAMRITVQIADALSEAHNRGVVHRDLKPSNIMLGEVGRQRDHVKVLDFGIAKVEGVAMTRTGTILGTPPYMSPEQFRGAPVDGRSDLYSVGIMLYEMVAGRLPFVAETPAAYMHKHLNVRPEQPGRLSPSRTIPPALERVIMRLLAKEPGQRFAGAGELAAALEAGLAEAPGAGPRPVGRPSALWLGLGLGGLVLLAALVTVALGLFLRQRQDRPAGRLAAALSPEPALPGASSPREEDPPASERPARRQAAGGPAEGLKSDPGPGRQGRGRARQGSGRRKTAQAPSKTIVPAQDPLAARSPDASLPSGAGGGGQAGQASASAPSPEVAQLEVRLRQVLRTSRLPPSSVEQIFSAYRENMEQTSPLFRSLTRKSYLAGLIRSYQHPRMQLRPEERRSIEQLECIFLYMATKRELSVEKRRISLNSIRNTYERANFPAEDKPFYRRMALLETIKREAADPEAALRDSKAASCRAP